MNSDAAELQSRYLIPIGIIGVIVLAGLFVFFYFFRKKAKHSPMETRKVSLTKRQTNIDVIEEVDEESSSGIELTVGHQMRRHGTWETFP